MSAFMVIGGIALLIAFWVIVIYNKLVSKRQFLHEGESGIDVQLKRRNDLIPNLIETVKGYMGHEKSVLEKVTELRTQSQNLSGGSLADRAKTEGMLSGALANLFAVAENYPDLKASNNFIELQKSLSETEDQIQLSRRYYNGTARELNTLIQSFPSNLVANAFNFKTAEFFEIDNATERAVPQVKI